MIQAQSFQNKILTLNFNLFRNLDTLKTKNELTDYRPTISYKSAPVKKLTK